MAMALSAAALPCQSGMRQTAASLRTLNPSCNAIQRTAVKFSDPSCNAIQRTAVKFSGLSRAGRHRRGAVVRCYVRPLRPVEERFRIQVERNVDEARLKELGVKRWSKWEADLCVYEHEWKVDEQVYIVKGSVCVVPEDCEDCTYFYAGDLVRFPKWFCATLSFEGEYEQRYRFLAYGDD